MIRSLYSNRWYHANNVKPLFPFGHGLSYTQFQYSNIQFALSRGRSSSQSDIGTLSVTVTNSGKAVGADVVQLYITYPAVANEPPRQLKHFYKTSDLQVGESTLVSFPVTQRDVSIYDESVHDWTTVSGQFLLEVGSSSSDIRMSVSFTN